MAIQVNDLKLYPAVETIGIRSQYYSGNDPHYARMEWRPSYSSIWIPGFRLTQDTRPTIVGQFENNSWGNLLNLYVNEWRGVIFGLPGRPGLDPNTSYDVRVTYYDLNNNEIGHHQASTITRNNNPNIPTSDVRIVATNGNDTGTGSEANPFATLQRAFQNAGPGTTVMMRGGIYSQALGRQGLSGQKNNYITLLSYQGESVIIDGSSLGTNLPGQSGGEVGYKGLIYLNTCSFFRILGLNIQNSQLNLMVLYSTGEGIIIENNTLRGGNLSGSNDTQMVQRRYGGRDMIIQNNRFIQEGSPKKIYGLYNWGAGWGLVVCDNLFTSPDGSLYDGIGGGPENKLGDEFSYTGEYDVYRNVADGHSDDGYQIEGKCLNYRCRQNTIRGGNVGIAICPVMIGPCYSLRNTIFNVKWYGYKLGDNTTGHTYVYHNTILGVKGYQVTNGGLRNLHMANNIVDTTNYIYEIYNYDQDNDVDYDLVFTTKSSEVIKWKGARYNTLAAFQSATGQGVHSIWGQASFVNRGSGDLRLQPGSLGIEKGVVIPGINDADSPWPFIGAAPNIGAIEQDGSAPPPTADFKVSANSGPAPLTVNFTNKSTGAIVTHHWDFGDGSNSNEASPTHTFVVQGSYRVVLTVTGPGGTNSAAMIIAVSGEVATFTLTISKTEGGNTNPTPGSYPYPKGQEVPVVALPDSGYQFVEWQENGVVIGTTNTIPILMNADRDIMAVFQEIVVPPEEFALSISVRGNGTTEPRAGSYTVVKGGVVTVKATPASGYVFFQWEGDLSGTLPEASFMVNRNMSIVAVFTKKELPGFFELLWDVAPFFPWEGPPLPRFTGLDWEKLRT